MLASLAETLDVDINELIYGLRAKKQPAIDKRTLIISWGLVLLLAAVLHFLSPWSFELQKRYYIIGIRLALEQQNCLSFNDVHTKIPGELYFAWGRALVAG